MISWRDVTIGSPGIVKSLTAGGCPSEETQNFVKLRTRFWRAAFIALLSSRRLSRRTKAFPATQAATAPQGSGTHWMGGEKRNPNPTSQYIHRSPPAGRSLLSKWAPRPLCVVSCVWLRHVPRLATMRDSSDPGQGSLPACRQSED